MKISKLVAELERIKEYYGDIETQLHEAKGNGKLVGHESFFLVPEEYTNDDGTEKVICNIRWWPH